MTIVKENFDSINLKLKLRRDDFDDVIFNNIMCAYEYLNWLIKNDIDIFGHKGLNHIIELNHRVLCGSDPDVRKEYKHHLDETQKKFYKGIHPIKKWYSNHYKKDSHLKVASEIYVGVVSQPQLFIEGNHRTGSLIASWILLNGNSAPFVLTIENAIAFFDPSSQIKFTDKRKFESTFKLPKYKKSFKKFLKENIYIRHLSHEK